MMQYKSYKYSECNRDICGRRRRKGHKTPYFTKLGFFFARIVRFIVLNFILEHQSLEGEVMQREVTSQIFKISSTFSLIFYFPLFQNLQNLYEARSLVLLSFLCMRFHLTLLKLFNSLIMWCVRFEKHIFLFYIKQNNKQNVLLRTKHKTTESL